MGLIGSLTQAVTNTVGSPSDYNANFEAIRAAFDDSLVLTDVARTITVQHTFNPASAQAPFLIGANAQGQKVTGLNADKINGRDLIGVIGVRLHNTLDEIDGTGTAIPIGRMPVNGWLGVPLAVVDTPSDGGTLYYRWDILHGTHGPTATDITSTQLTLDATEQSSATGTFAHVYTGTSQADAERTAGDLLWIKKSQDVSAPTTHAKGLTVLIPIYGSNPH